MVLEQYRMLGKGKEVEGKVFVLTEELVETRVLKKLSNRLHKLPACWGW